MQAPFIVALLGAECTGKSTLAAALAAELNAVRRSSSTLVPEFLREWCTSHGRTPERAEQTLIAAEQARRIEAAARTHAVVVCDTTPLMTAIYSRHYFDDESLLADALAFQRRCQLTLLCAPDLPWQPDGLQRDGPAVRSRVDVVLRRTLADAGIEAIDIAGSASQRLASALAPLRSFVSELG